MRLIDADAFVKKVVEYSHQSTKTIGMALDATPTVDAVERKRGEWINDKGLYRCSFCNELWLDWWANVVPIERMNKKMRFCPNCGADMRGENNG